MMSSIYPRMMKVQRQLHGEQLQSDSKGIVTVMLKALRGGCTSYALGWFGISSQEIHLLKGWAVLVPHLHLVPVYGFYGVIFQSWLEPCQVLMRFDGEYFYFRISVAVRSALLQHLLFPASMMASNLLWKRGSYYCRFSVDDGVVHLWCISSAVVRRIYYLLWIRDIYFIIVLNVSLAEREVWNEIASRYISLFWVKEICCIWLTQQL